LNALSIVDQIHKFAVTTHRDFVIKHLEPWLQLAEEELDSFCNDDGWTENEILSSSFRLSMLNSRNHTSRSMPLWKELEEAARLELLDKRNKTREFNRNAKRRTSDENAVILDEDALMEEVD